MIEEADSRRLSNGTPRRLLIELEGLRETVEEQSSKSRSCLTAMRGNSSGSQFSGARAAVKGRRTRSERWGGGSPHITCRMEWSRARRLRPTLKFIQK